jgi:hypothetical protein
MKILSNFKDYYDIQLKYGQDKNIVYRRFTAEPEEIRDHKFTELEFKKLGRPYKSGKARAGAVYFCGTVYPFIRFEYYEALIDEKHSNYCSCCSDKHHVKYLYDIAAVDKLIETVYAKEPKLLKQYKENSAAKYTSAYLSNRKTFEQVFKDEKFKKLVDHAHDAPIAVLLESKYDKTRVIRNPVLDTLQFVRVFQGVLAFQELERWMNNIAVPIKPIPDIDDKYMAASKGYDKFSFRKAPTKYPRKDR